MPFERFRFLNDDHVVSGYDHEPSESDKHARRVRARAQGSTYPAGFVYLGTVHKGKEASSGVIRDGDGTGDRPEARKVDVEFTHLGQDRAFTFDAGQGFRWQFLTVHLYREGSRALGYTYRVIGRGIRHVELVDADQLSLHSDGPFDVATLPAQPPGP